MGQYLTIGLVTKIVEDKERAMKKGAATPEEVRAAMQEAYNQSGIYSMEETENVVRLMLSPEVAEAEMVDLLTDFYKLRYGDDGKWQEELEEIKKRHTLDEWIALADGNCSELFQLDSFVWIYTPFRRDYWDYALPTGTTQIMLSIDGKIVMECYDRLFKFFTRLIRERLSKYRLANALFVAISG